ncbi:MAG: hypothetical protein AABZ74_09820 [Cyanobacteriota bacterium]
MNVIFGVLLFLGVTGFIGVSIFLFIKRLNENKDKISNISKQDYVSLKEDLEVELKIKKEKELKELEKGDLSVIKEVIDRIFKSSKLAGFIKTQNFILYDKSKVSITINLADQEDIIDSEKQITLKNGEVYTQKKHFLAIKKEYSEKTFICAYKAIEEIYNSIPTIFRIYLNIKLSKKDETDEKNIYVLSLDITKDDYNSVKNKKLEHIQKIDTFKNKYNYDLKLYELFEIEPLEMDEKIFSLEKSMNSKVSQSTVFIGSSTIDDNEKEKIVDSNTKISDLKNFSLMMNNNIIVKENNSINLEKDEITLFLNKKDFNLVRSEILENEIVEIVAIDKNNKEILINYSKNSNIIKEEELKEMFFKAIKKNISIYMFLSKGSFSLSAVNYADVNNIEIFDTEKINKILSK